LRHVVRRGKSGASRLFVVEGKRWDTDPEPKES